MEEFICLVDIFEDTHFNTLSKPQGWYELAITIHSKSWEKDEHAKSKCQNPIVEEGREDSKAWESRTSGGVTTGRAGNVTRWLHSMGNTGEFNTCHVKEHQNY